MIYRYPNLVISCEGEKDHDYSEVYGRLLIDRALKAGLLTKESDSLYVPVETVVNHPVAEYYHYPETQITVTDLRERELSIKGRLCTSRGMDQENTMLDVS